MDIIHSVAIRIILFYRELKLQFARKHVTILGHGIDLNIGSRIIVCNNAEINIGDYTGMSQVSLYSKDKIQIGNHSVIGVNSVVTCNIPADEVWAGNPAKFMREIKY